jgi:putative toxin-antitoxin system antitoxin component (TIGR02293 family)
MTINAPKIAQILGGERTLGRRIRTVDDLRVAVERGLPVRSLDHTVSRIAGKRPEATELRHRIVPKSTLQRRRTRLTAEESQRLERLARMIALAEDVWEDPARAYEFLSHPQPQLRGERPIDLASSDLGTRQVEELLFRLEYSLPV